MSLDDKLEGVKISAAFAIYVLVGAFCLDFFGGRWDVGNEGTFYILLILAGLVLYFVRPRSAPS